MASLPARHPPQRRSSPEQNSNDQSQTPSQTTPIPTRSAHSEDSQTLFLNSPKEDSKQQQTPNPQATQSGQGGGNDGEVKKCWICFSDSTEDTPDTSPWRNPCPCALVAHEECLLDWIADIEAPNRNRSRSIHAPKIECPQCKSEIKLSRPRDVVVEAVRGLQRVTAQLTTPGALTLLFGTLYNESMLFGVHSIYAIFGSRDGVRILEPLLYNIVRAPVELDGTSAAAMGRRTLRIFLDHMVHWRLYVGIPLIGPMLVLSRTTLADSILPVMPVFFFATQLHARDDPLDFKIWPPSAGFAFATLPYLRQAYNSAYARLFAEKEKQWLREIQPRVGQNQGEEGGNGEAGNGNQDVIEEQEGDNMFEVRIDGGIWEEWEDEAEIPQDQQGAPNAGPQHPQGPDQPQQQQPQAANQADGPADPPPDIQDNRADAADAAPAAAPPAQANADQPQPQRPAPRQQQQDQQPPQPPAAQPEQQRRLSFSPTSIAHSVLGALIFPTLAGLSGELLKLALPLSWTTKSVANPLTKAPRNVGRGLLQEKWGRSLVGGCLLVVVKDAVMLYVRWKMARIQRERRVVDFEGKRGGEGEVR